MSSVKNTPKKRYWRGLGEFEDSPEFRRFVENEFSEPVRDLEPNSKERRRFLQLMGASFALAGATSGCWQEDHILPHTRRPDGVIPGVPRYFATAMDLGGFATGLLVKSYDGRPIKVEGNPNHPDSAGACNVFHQASVLELYDPDRSKTVLSNAAANPTESNWVEFKKAVKDLSGSWRANQGATLRVLSESSSSPSVQDMKRRLLAAYPQAKWHEYEAISDDNARAGSRLALDASYRPVYAFDKADVVVSLDGDFVGCERGALRFAPAFVAARNPERETMNRLYVVESAFTMTGGIADHRLMLRSELIKAVAAALDAGISAKAAPPADIGPPQARPAAQFLDDPKVAKFLAVVEKDLLASRGRSLIVTGEHQPPEVHALVHRLNAVLGNVGTTVSYVPDPLGDRALHADAIKELSQEMNAGKVETLIILGGNPVYSTPSDLSFAQALAKVKTSIHLGLFRDETARRCAWHLPQAHYLETWGDARGYDGAITITQPLIAPLYDGKSVIELIALVLGDSTKDGIEIVKRTLSRRIQDERIWRKSVHDGIVMGSAMTPVQPQLKPLGAVKFTERELGPLKVSNGQFEIVLQQDSKLYDGRFANNGWLQELPDMVTKLTWGNAAIISPVTAAELGVQNEELVTLTVGGNSVTVPALVSPGQTPGSIRVALGYGRTAAGIVGFGGYLEHGLVDDLTEELKSDDVHPIGVNAYVLRTTALSSFGGGLSVQGTGNRYKLAVTELTHAIKDEIGKEGVQSRLPKLVREGTHEEYKQHPRFAKEIVEHEPLLSLWHAPVAYEGHKWGMTVDLNRCIGCNACVVACNSENNVPVVGRERVLQGREMQWIRIDRYYKGSPEEPELVHQPLLCQQCENAPCEEVCPVGATQHSREGLNDMVYNRCIGTRYCSNNCPYKVRRFNYFNMNEDLKQEKNKSKLMVMNPDVTVRFRGVMEKCTFCIQRIMAVRIDAKNHRRAIKDGEIVTACQQTCPTKAIVFGDLNDPQSEVVKLQQLPRSYGLLEELNTRPRLLYLARVRNPHPELS